MKAHAMLSTGMLCLLPFLAGCATTSLQTEARMQNGYVFYCDGSGGGGVLRNYAGGVRKGLRDAGYNGSGEVFNWHTGLGVTADHTSGEAYKRSKAADLAKSIQKYLAKYRGAPVNLMGLSAGTVVVVFALEALPQQGQVDNAFLLSPSISATYDLTDSLRRVSNRMYVFTSSSDAVLRFLVPWVGTADRASGRASSAGLYGFRRPPGASAETQAQYAKLAHIHWKAEFARKGNGGGHTDVVKAPFIQEYIAPLVMARPSRSFDTSTAGRVRNPDYERWAKFAPGSWVRWKGYETIGAQRQAVYVQNTLIEKETDELIVEWTYTTPDGDLSRPIHVQEYVEKAWIEATDNPFTHPQAKVEDLLTEAVTVGGKTLQCRVRRVRVGAEFPDWGRDIAATLHRNENVPGGLVRASMTSHKGDQPFEFTVEVADFEVAAR